MKLFRNLLIILGIAFLFVALTGQFNPSLKILNPGPVQTFEKNCARCHGPHGSFYGSGFGSREYNDLRKIVGEMMRGPAFLKPSKADVEAMTAYHYALGSGEPFICITRYDSTNNILHGEVMFQDQLFVKQKQEDASKVKVAVDSTGRWQTELFPSLLLIAENDSAQTTINPREKQWSH
ncbi:MAG: cytochrome c [Bacteroidales bacterium]